MKPSAMVMKTILVAALWLSFPALSPAGDFRFTGTVTDGAGRAVKDAEIFIYDSATIRRPADFITPRTGSDGVFSIRLPSGKYWVVARVRKGDKFGPLLPGDRHSGEPAEIEAADDPEVRLDFTVADIREAAQNRPKTREDYFRLSGRILDREGKPVANAYVFARNEAATEKVPSHISSWTDERGEYVLFLPQGKHFVRGALQFPPESKVEGSEPVPVDVVKKEMALDVVVALDDDIPTLPEHDVDDD